MVLSDHGHRKQGGHGGAEEVVAQAFLIAWGHRVKKGAQLPPRPMRDVASTLTLVAGARTPSSNLGAPMIDLFELNEREAARSVLDAVDQVATFGCGSVHSPSCDELPVVREALVEQERGAARAVELLSRIVRERDERAEEAERSAKLWRLAGGMVVGIGLVLLARVRSFAWPAIRSAWLAPALLFATYASALMLFGYRPTLSTMTQTEVFFGDAAKAGAIAAALVLLVGARLRWRTREAAYLGLSAFTLMVPVWAAAGASPRDLGPPLASVLVFMLSPLVPIAAMTAIGIAIIAHVRSLGQPAATPGAS